MVAGVLANIPSLTIAIPEGASDATRASLSQDNAQRKTIDALTMKTLSLLRARYNPTQVFDGLRNAKVVVCSEEEGSSFTLELTMAIDGYPPDRNVIAIKGKGAFTPHTNAPIKDSFSVTFDEAVAY